MLRNACRCVVYLILPGPSYLAHPTWFILHRPSYPAHPTWPILPGPSYLAHPTWPILPGPSYPAHPTWPILPGPSYLAHPTWPDFTSSPVAVSYSTSAWECSATLPGLRTQRQVEKCTTQELEASEFAAASLLRWP